MRTIVTVIFLFLIKGVVLSTPNSSLHEVGRPKYEHGVFLEINKARVKPWKYKNNIEAYKELLNGDVLSLAGRPSLLLYEGSGVIQKTIDNLMKRGSTVELIRSGPLDAVARAQLHDLLDNRDLGHVGKDGATLKIRVKRFANAIGPLAENISFSDASPSQVVITMLLDDGVPSRQHRENILNPDFRLIGVACGISTKSVSICVIEFARELAVSKPRLL